MIKESARFFVFAVSSEVVVDSCLLRDIFFLGWKAFLCAADPASGNKHVFSQIITRSIFSKFSHKIHPLHCRTLENHIRKADADD